MDVHGDEAIPANFLAGFEGIPSFTDKQLSLFKSFSDALERISPDFQTRQGYEIPAPGEANMSMSTTQLAERYGCVSMTLEMPFKDNFDLPDPLYGWSPERSKFLAFACLDALHSDLAELQEGEGGEAAGGEGRRLMPQLVLVRHGQSQWNLENRFTGWWDVDLSDQGVAEARAAGTLLKERGFEFDRCFTSVLTRAIRTLHLVLHELDSLWLPVAKDWHLNERHYGGLTGLNKQEMIDKVGAEQVKIWRRSYDIPPPPLPGDSEYDVSRDRRYAERSGAQHREPQGHDRARASLLRSWRSSQRCSGARACSLLRTAIRSGGSSSIYRESGIRRSSGVEIPTGQPLVYELNDDLSVSDPYYLSERARLGRDRLFRDTWHGRPGP